MRLIGIISRNRELLTLATLPVLMLLVLQSCAPHTTYHLSDDEIPKMSDEQLLAKYQEIFAELIEHTNQLNAINGEMNATDLSNPVAVGSGLGNVIVGFHHKSAGLEAVRQGNLIREEIKRRGLKIPGEP
jgi:hypothetical protein